MSAIKTLPGVNPVIQFFFFVIFAIVCAGSAKAEVFAPAKGVGSVAAVKDGGNVVVTVTGISATQLVHFRGHGDRAGSIHTAKLADGKGVLEDVAKNGGRFQLRDDAGKWLLVAPANNPYEMVGVVQECKRSKNGCALEVK